MVLWIASKNGDMKDEQYHQGIVDTLTSEETICVIWGLPIQAEPTERGGGREEKPPGGRPEDDDGQIRRYCLPTEVLEGDYDPGIERMLASADFEPAVCQEPGCGTATSTAVLKDQRAQTDWNVNPDYLERRIVGMNFGNIETCADLPYNGLSQICGNPAIVLFNSDSPIPQIFNGRKGTMVKSESRGMEDCLGSLREHPSTIHLFYAGNINPRTLMAKICLETDYERTEEEADLFAPRNRGE